jgi:hypothetical protein
MGTRTSRTSSAFPSGEVRWINGQGDIPSSPTVDLNIPLIWKGAPSAPYGIISSLTRSGRSGTGRSTSRPQLVLCGNQKENIGELLPQEGKKTISRSFSVRISSFNEPGSGRSAIAVSAVPERAGGAAPVGIGSLRRASYDADQRTLQGPCPGARCSPRARDYFPALTAAGCGAGLIACTLPMASMPQSVPASFSSTSLYFFCASIWLPAAS